MAKIFNYLPPTDATNIEHDKIPITSKNATRLTFTRNTIPIIYCNYPEQIGAKGLGLALAEHKYCINRQQIPTGEAQIFFSHWNQTGKTLKYRIQIYNPNGSTATVTRNNCGFDSGWPNPGNAVVNFYNSTATTISVPKTSSAWLTQEYSITSDVAFNGLVKLTTDKSVIITVYAYFNASAIKGTEVVFPYSTDWANDVTVYSGIGNGTSLRTNHGTIAVSQLSNAPYYFSTNNGCSSGSGLPLNSNEMTPIKLVGTNLTATADNSTLSLSNLGNWCTENNHHIGFRNDLGYDVTIYGRIGSNDDGSTQVICISHYMNSIKLETDHTWKWCKINLPNGVTTYVDFKQILASYGAAPTFYSFSIE